MTSLALIIFADRAEAQPPSGRDYLSWKLVENKRVDDGGQRAVYRLLMPDGAKAVENLEVFYLLQPYEYSRSSGRLFAPTEIYRQKPDGSPKSPVVTIYCGRPARLEVLAGATIDGRFYLAKTVLNSYAYSGLDNPQARLASSLPDWPNLSLARGAEYYRAQAGEELQFALEANQDDIVSAKVAEEGRLNQSNPVRLDGGRFSYTPPLDPLLSAPAYSVTRDLVFVAEAGSAVLSYYLPVGRSRFGHLYLKPGLATVAATVVISFLAVMLAGRRFKWR